MGLNKKFLITLLSLLIGACMVLVEKKGPSGTSIPILGIGDSRMNGFGSTNPQSTSWLNVFAGRLPPYFRVQNNGVNGDTLFAHSSTPTLRAATTATVAAYVGSAPKSTFIIQLDYNDWNNGVLATDYGTWLNAQLTSLATISGLTTVVFASIDFSTYGSTNVTSGNTILDFLTQQQAAVASHSTSSVIVLGKPMLTFGATPNQYFDAIHPNDSGYITIANAIAPQIEDL